MTIDGDTKADAALILRAFEAVSHGSIRAREEGEEALGRLITTLSEQEAELERAREAIREYFRSNGSFMASDGEWSSSVGYSDTLSEYLESIGEKVPKHRKNPFDEHGNYRALTQDSPEEGREP